MKASPIQHRNPVRCDRHRNHQAGLNRGNPPKKPARPGFEFRQGVLRVKANLGGGNHRRSAGQGSTSTSPRSTKLDKVMSSASAPSASSYGNTIKKAKDIRYLNQREGRAHVRAPNSEADLRNIAKAATAFESLWCHILTEGSTTATARARASSLPAPIWPWPADPWHVS